MGDADEQKYLDVQLREYFAAVDEEKAEHKREKKREAARRKRANKSAAKRASSEATVASDTGQSSYVRFSQYCYQKDIKFAIY